MAGLYIHIPYCRSKCFYCDFYSRPTTSDMEAYIDTVIAEWHLRTHEVSDKISTVYIGGGTPSLLPYSLLKKLIQSVGKDVDIAKLNEFTIEANPEDISTDNLTAWRDLGINRVSIGIQSFNQTELNAIGRRHDVSAAINALQSLKSANINFNADLIYGLPGQDLNGWKQNLTQLLDYNPPHFSAYLLSYEHGTRLTAMRDKGSIVEASETLACEMYDLLCATAHERGYNHYEISNFALPGMEAKHNSAYWDYTPYLGLGVAAHSFDGYTRRYNPLNISQYITTINSGATAYEVDEEDATNRFNDYIITSLRTNRGFSQDFAKEHFNAELLNEFKRNLRHDNAVTIVDDQIYIPEALWLKSDAILRDLIV